MTHIYVKTVWKKINQINTKNTNWCRLNYGDGSLNVKNISQKCDRYCVQCNLPVCGQCNSSREHSDHETVDVVLELERKSKVLESDLQDLENKIYHKYQEIASSITVQKDDLNKDSKKLKTDINNHG